jgi:hypothetical protein
MKGANFIIGYVRGTEVVISDQVGTRIDRHDADVKNKGTQDVVVGGGYEAGNITRIEFSIPLVSNDSRDKPLQPGARVPILLCFGPQDNFTKVHTRRKQKGTSRYSRAPDYRANRSQCRRRRAAPRRRSSHFRRASWMSSTASTSSWQYSPGEGAAAPPHPWAAHFDGREQ